MLFRAASAFTLVAENRWEDAMAIVSSSRGTVEQQLKELLEQRFDTKAQAAMLVALKERVRQYEARYGMSSECIHDAIEAGELVEDLDVCDWIFDYDLLRSVEEE